MEEAASRESLEEAGVLGNVEVSFFIANCRLHYVIFMNTFLTWMRVYMAGWTGQVELFKQKARHILRRIHVPFVCDKAA